MNEGEYFACHETLEPLWLAAQGDERIFLHALIQVAVALHHQQQGNAKGAQSVANRALLRLQALPERMQGIDLRALAQQLEQAVAGRSGNNPLVQVVIEKTRGKENDR